MLSRLALGLALLVLAPQVIVRPDIPLLTALTPTSGLVGSSATVTGQRFGPGQENTRLTLNGVNVVVTAWSDTSVTFTVPATTTGAVVMIRGGVASNSLIFTVLVSGTVFYVSLPPVGDDSRACNTAQNPATPRASITQGAACLTPGTTLLVRAGTYAESLVNAVASGTSWTNKVGVAAYPGETVLLQPSSGAHAIAFSGNQQYIEFDGININGANTTSSSILIDDTAGGVPHHLRFQNADIHGREGLAPAPEIAAIEVGGHDSELSALVVHGTGGPMGISLTGDTNTVSGCAVTAVSYTGIQVYRPGGSPTGNSLINNRIDHLNASSFFGMATTTMFGIVVVGTNTFVANNIIDNITFAYTSGNAGIDIYAGSGNQIINNTLYNNTTESIRVESGASTTTVRNNILYANVTNAVADLGTSSSVGTNLLGTDPAFVNPSFADYRLQASSPAINTGTANSLTTDFADDERPQGAAIDIGSYEYAAPNLLSLTPNFGLVGSSTVLAGTNFGATQGTSSVLFHTGASSVIAAAVTAWSATSITVTVPATAIPGGVYVLVSNVQSNSLTYTASGGSGPTYYVSPSGVDPPGRNCATAQNSATPFRTITQGLTCLSAGSTLVVRAGTYNESLVNNIPSGTSASNLVRITNFPGETVWLFPASAEYVVYLDGNQQYIEFDGINMNGAGTPDVMIYFNDNNGGAPHHIRMKNAEIHQREGIGQKSAALGIGGHDNEFLYLTVHGTGGPYAFYVGSVVGNSNTLIDHCDIYDVSLAGIQLYHNGGSSNGSTVSNTRIHHISQSGFFGAPDGRFWGILIAGNNNTIVNNIIDNNTVPYPVGGGNWGLFVYYGSGNRIYNNTITANTTGGISVYINGSATTLENNIVYGNTVDNIDDTGSAPIPPVTNLIGINPSFMNPAAFNFQITAGSLARNTGTNNAIATVDFAGTVRPQEVITDIGAYEYVP